MKSYKHINTYYLTHITSSLTTQTCCVGAAINYEVAVPYQHFFGLSSGRAVCEEFQLPIDCSATVPID